MSPPTPGVALVTGAAGQDGGYLCERLVVDGWQVHGLVRPGGSPAPAGVRVHRGDLADPGLFGRLLPEVAPDEVYHLAGESSVGRSWADPARAAELVGAATARLLQACHELPRPAGRPTRVLLAGSAEAFGDLGDARASEQTPLRPVSPYGAAKAFVQHLGACYRQAGLPVSTAILFPHESPRRPGRFVTRKITSAAARIALGRQDRLVLGRLDVRRDWGWAPEYVDAMVRLQRLGEPQDVVLATGVGRSVADFATAAFAAAGLGEPGDRLASDPALYRPGEARQQVGDPSLAARVLGWHAAVPLEETVHRMVAHDLAVERAARPGRAP